MSRDGSQHDPVSQVALYGIHLMAGLCIPAVVCILITLFLVHRETIVDVALQERSIITYESFPANLAHGWLLYAPNYATNPERTTPAHQDAVDPNSGSRIDRGVAYGLRALEKIQPAKEKVVAYLGLATPRLIILISLLPSLLVIGIMAWWYGSHLNARWANAGQPFSSNAHKWSVFGFSLFCGMFILYLVLPVVIPSTAIIFPAIGMATCMVLVRRHRA